MAQHFAGDLQLTFRILETGRVDSKEFVKFWAPLYSYREPALYLDNIGKPLNPERVRSLFEWKNGSRLSKRKADSVETNYVNRIAEARLLQKRSATAREFLDNFPEGGAIWRIFWLHCCDPGRFPIYDQHVHRAMVVIRSGRIEEISKRDKDKVNSYIDEFLPFVSEFRGSDSRKVDQALWFFGKAVKSKMLRPLFDAAQPVTPA